MNWWGSTEGRGAKRRGHDKVRHKTFGAPSLLRRFKCQCRTWLCTRVWCVDDMITSEGREIEFKVVTRSNIWMSLAVGGKIHVDATASKYHQSWSR